MHMFLVFFKILGKRGYDLTMCSSFVRKSVISIQVVARCDLLLCLSDGQITAHELSEPFALKGTINELKQITAFSYKVSEVWLDFWHL